jgi:hypothetical protein
MDHRGGEIEVCGEALVGFVGAQARMATRLNFLSLQKRFSIRWRHLYISASAERGCARRGCWKMTALARAR